MLTPARNTHLSPFGSENYRNKSLFPGVPDDIEDEIDVEELMEDPSFSEDINYLREFILSTALYVEELENSICDRSDEFWEAREHAYRIITGLLIDLYRYDMAD
jgi:hypothetical protein